MFIQGDHYLWSFFAHFSENDCRRWNLIEDLVLAKILIFKAVLGSFQGSIRKIITFGVLHGSKYDR